MSDLISRQAAIDAVHKNYDTILDFKSDGCTVADSFEDIINALPSAQQIGWVHINDIYRLISGHSNYHGDNILAALTCLAEGKEVKNPITVLDAQPERNPGKWNPISVGYFEIYECNQCGEKEEYERNFCPNCGADMRGAERRTDD